MDLFGEQVTSPQTSIKKGVMNAAHGFAEFWKAWPAGPRKAAKQQCLDKWATKECAESADHILKHVEWLKESDDWKRGFICAPLVYLNQQRWLDWEPPAERKRQDMSEVFAKRDREASPPPPEVRKKIAALLGRQA